MQEAAAGAGAQHAVTGLWAALLRARALLPPLPSPGHGDLRDEAAHEGSTAGATPSGAVSLTVRAAGSWA